MRCSCDHQHVIADNYGWLGPQANIEQILAERGEEVVRLRDLDELDVEGAAGGEAPAIE